MIISFAKTTDALLAGQKTVTRRDWSDKHAAHFKAGQLDDARATLKGKNVQSVDILMTWLTDGGLLEVSTQRAGRDSAAALAAAAAVMKVIEHSHGYKRLRRELATFIDDTVVALAGHIKGKP